MASFRTLARPDPLTYRVFGRIALRSAAVVVPPAPASYDGWTITCLDLTQGHSPYPRTRAATRPAQQHIPTSGHRATHPSRPAGPMKARRFLRTGRRLPSIPPVSRRPTGGRQRPSIISPSQIWAVCVGWWSNPIAGSGRESPWIGTRHSTGRRRLQRGARLGR